ncbi:hypothetical protein LI221_09250 [Faecalimonas umbilicata]|nr:hypothetical protein [Faecalimonas umbilicata]
MRTKKNVSVGIDGITCVVSGCLVPCETKFPEDSDKPLMKLTPRHNKTEIGIILPRAIRQNNNIGFRVIDTKMLLDTVQTINRALKTIIHRDWSELLVKQIEVACTVDVGCADELTIDSLMNFMSRIFLQVDKPNKESNIQNAVRTKPIMKYVTGKRRKNCTFLKDEVTKSLESTLCSNKRLKWKAYSKGAFSEFGGDTSIFRLEGVYCERGIKYVLQKKDDYVTLQDVLKQDVIRAFIDQFKVDYAEIIIPRIRGFLKEAEQIIFNQLHHSSAYNALLINRDVVYDMRIYRRSLRRYYKEQSKSTGAYRKMLCSVAKRMQGEGIDISDKVIAILEDISSAMKISDTD